MISLLLSVPQFFRFALLIIYVGCIMALSLLPPQDLPKVQLFEGADKVIHFLMYLIFSILGCWSLKTEFNRTRILFIIPITMGWGIFMEIMQLNMHIGRSFSWYDELANSVGVLVGVIGYQLAVYKYAR
jgi:VanZ family protein